MRVPFSVLLLGLLAGPMAVADSEDGRERSGKAPDSIVTCEGSAGSYVVINGTVPPAISLAECPTAGCSACIRSLEGQGCKVVKTAVDPGESGSEAAPGSSVGGAVGRSDPRVTFLLSCEKP